SMSMDYYETLGVSKDATAPEIKKAYHRLAKRLHPDKNKDDANAKRMFQQLQKAYEVLGDKNMQFVYDQ
ncbi:hypothetical protein IFM89_037394, partial [Coptis chinensis]